MVACALPLATRIWPDGWVVFPSVSDCVQRHSHAGKEDTHTLGEEILYPLREEEPGTGLVLSIWRRFVEHEGSLTVFVALCEGHSGAHALRKDAVSRKGSARCPGFGGAVGRGWCFSCSHAEHPSATPPDPSISLAVHSLRGQSQLKQGAAHR